jgi:oligopeptide transport system substrate-binding protein
VSSNFALRVACCACTLFLLAGVSPPLKPVSSMARQVCVGSPNILRMADEGVSRLHASDLDPPAETIGANSIFVISLIFGGLVRLDDKLRVAPDGASSWTLSKDKRTYTFHIRRGLRLGNGRLVTADDFAYSLNRAFSPRFKEGNTDYYLSNIQGSAQVIHGRSRSVSGIEALNSATLRITIVRPAASFLDQLAFSTSFVVPRGLIRRYNRMWTKYAVGTGPFLVQRWLPGEIDLARNPYYWNGKPKLSSLRILFVSNPETAYKLYQKCGLDVMGAVGFPPAKLEQASKEVGFNQVPQLLTEYVLPNTRQVPLSNVHLRRALSFALDRVTLVNRFLKGLVVPAKNIVPPGMPGYDPALPGQWFSKKLAGKERARAGFPHGKHPPALTLTYDSSDPSQVALATILQAMWKQNVGLTVRLRPLGNNAFSNALSSHHFQLALASWGADYPDPQNFLSFQLSTGVVNNFGGFSSLSFDRLTKEADEMRNGNPRRFLLYHQAETIALVDVGWMVLYHGKSAILVNPHVHGLAINAGGLTAANWATVTVQ